MNEHGKSDGSVIPAKLPNKAAAAEAGEGRGPTKGNTDGKPRPGRSAGPVCQVRWTVCGGSTTG